MKYLKLLLDLYKSKMNTTKTTSQIQALQQKKLRKILHYAYNNSSYYHRAFEEANITLNNIDTVPLSSFPTMDKSLFFQHFDEIVTTSDLKQEELRQFDKQGISRKPYKGKYHIVHSSGSTGKPSYFVYDELAWSSMLIGIIRAALWDMSMSQIIQLLVHNPRILYIAATDGRYGGAMAVGDGIDKIHAAQLYLDIKTPLCEWIKQLYKFKPNIIIGYPSALKILGELVEKGDINLNVSRVISCGEPLGISLRYYLEKIFHTTVVNFYGASESLALGVEVNSKEGIILFDDMNVIEVQNGTMYLTSLYNLVQPLIRYKLSDSITLQQSDRNSRYPFSRAVGILGRNEDLLWFEDKNGDYEFIHPLAIEGFCIEGLKDYQFRQIDNDMFEMLAEISETVSKDKIRVQILNQMKIILSQKHLDYVRFYVNFVDKIMPDPLTGKKRLIINTVEKERFVG